MTDLIPMTTLSAIVSNRDAAMAKMAEAVRHLEVGFRLAEEAKGFAQHAYGGATFTLLDRSRSEAFQKLFQHFEGLVSLETFRQQTDARTWMNLLVLTGLNDLMDKTAKDDLYKDLCGEVPPISEEAVLSVFKNLADDSKLIFQRGLARTFSDLDRRFKSHDAFKLGSRVILTRVFTEDGYWNHHSRMRDTLADMERVFSILDGNRAPNVRALQAAIEEVRGRHFGARQSQVDTDYFRVRIFKNGNAHLWFQRDDLVEKANLLLADYYGAVLPDAVAPEHSEADLRSTGGALAKDLSFYRTPPEAVEKALSGWDFRTGSKALEPSAGDGAFVRALLRRGCQVDAVEVHPGRHAELEAIRDPRLKVVCANFLQVPPRAEYDWVIMNPPFFGTHWMEHVTHAYEFLAPGGTLISILPVSAELGETEKHTAFREWAQKRARHANWLFSDLPAESFKDSGTRINTVTLTLYRKKAGP